jgi:type IV fimbrial biogenesis protein FimT
MFMRKPRQRGFTLIELLVTLSIAAVLLAVAAPSFSTFQRNAQLTSAANTLVAALNATRGEAIKRGRNALLVPSDNASWGNGWTAFVEMTSGNYTYTAGSDVLVFTREAPPSYLTLTATGTASASPPYILFDAQGYAVDKNSGFGSLVFNIVRNDVGSGSAAMETRRVIVSNTGRVRVCSPASDSTCTTAATQ